MLYVIVNQRWCSKQQEANFRVLFCRTSTHCSYSRSPATIFSYYNILLQEPRGPIWIHHTLCTRTSTSDIVCRHHNQGPWNEYVACVSTSDSGMLLLLPFFSSDIVTVEGNGFGSCLTLRGGYLLPVIPPVQFFSWLIRTLFWTLTNMSKTEPWTSCVPPLSPGYRNLWLV